MAKNYGTSPFFMGKSTISTGPFSIAIRKRSPEGSHMVAPIHPIETHMVFADSPVEDTHIWRFPKSWGVPPVLIHL